MESKNLKSAHEALLSLNPKIRTKAALQAVNQEFWFASPPDWFSVNKYPNVIGFDETHVIHGTNIKNIRILTWAELNEQENEQAKKIAA